MLRRRRLSRIERLIRAVTHIGAYGSPLVVGAMLGCIPEMRPLSISADGRYVALPCNKEGMIKSDARGEAADQLVILDLKTGGVRKFNQQTKGAFWLSNTADTLVALPELEGKLGVLIAKGEKVSTITDAGFPTLSTDGKTVVYVKLTDINGETLDGDLVRYDVDKGEAKELKVKGAFPEISSDGKHLLFAGKSGDKWALKVLPLAGGEARELVTLDPETAKLFVPTWYDNESVIYRNKTETSGDDGELYLTTLAGKTTELTSNDTVEHLPRTAGRDQVVYMAAPGGNVGTQAPGELYLAQRKDGKWQSTPLGIKTLFYAAAGDQVVYINENGAICRIALSDPKKVIELSPLIAKKLAE